MSEVPLYRYSGVPNTIITTYQGRRGSLQVERICIELKRADRKLKASREGSK